MMHRTILTHIIHIDAPNRLIPMLLLTPKLVLQIDNCALLVGNTYRKGKIDNWTEYKSKSKLDLNEH
jgi:hypothetical protein